MSDQRQRTSLRWPERWIDRVRLYRARIKEEAFRIQTVSPMVPAWKFEDTTRLGKDIGRFGRLLSWLPIGTTKQPLAATGDDT